MLRIRALTIVLAAALALTCGALALLAAAPAPLGASAQAHPTPEDLDGDEIPNVVDNCPLTPNGSQLNTDRANETLPGYPPGDGEGNNCDADDDNDGVADLAPDNCRLVPNPGQEDSTPGDGRGDACPPVDSDLDLLYDDDDNCPFVPNPDQRDLDGDDKGDVCDRDDDNDKYDDGFDNCPVVFNPDQADLDKDGIGSACDAEELIAGPAEGGGGGVPGASVPVGAVADRTAPKVTVGADARQRLADAGRAFIVTASCSEACSLKAELFADARAARRAGLGRVRVVLARGSWTMAGAGRTYVFARWTPAARRLRSGRRLVATLRLTATDDSGNARTVSRRVELRR